MSEQEKWDYIKSIDDEFWKGGGFYISEWCIVIIRDCDYAFVAGANLAAIITAAAAIETYLRAEYAAGQKLRFIDLIDKSPIEQDLRDEIHELRRYRNKWVHVAVPDDDEALIQDPSAYENEIEEWARRAQRTLRRTIYRNFFV